MINYRPMGERNKNDGGVNEKVEELEPIADKWFGGADLFNKVNTPDTALLEQLPKKETQHEIGEIKCRGFFCQHNEIVNGAAKQEKASHGPLAQHPPRTSMSSPSSVQVFHTEDATDLCTFSLSCKTSLLSHTHTHSHIHAHSQEN